MPKNNELIEKSHEQGRDISGRTKILELGAWRGRCLMSVPDCSRRSTCTPSVEHSQRLAPLATALIYS